MEPDLGGPKRLVEWKSPDCNPMFPSQGQRSQPADNQSPAATAVRIPVDRKEPADMGRTVHKNKVADNQQWWPAQ